MGDLAAGGILVRYGIAGKRQAGQRPGPARQGEVFIVLAKRAVSMFPRPDRSVREGPAWFHLLRTSLERWPGSALHGPEPLCTGHGRSVRNLSVAPLDTPIRLWLDLGPLPTGLPQPTHLAARQPDIDGLLRHPGKFSNVRRLQGSVLILRGSQTPAIYAPG